MWQLLGTCWTQVVLPVKVLGGKDIHASSHAYAWLPCVGSSVTVSLGTMGLHT